MKLKINVPPRATDNLDCRAVVDMIEAAFPAICQELKIDHLDQEVHLCFAELPRRVGGVTLGRQSGDPVGPAFVALALDRPSAILATFAHEMVHVKQQLLGELEATRDGMNLFRGEMFHSTTGRPDRDSPWEKEAYSKMGAVAAAAFESLPSQLKNFVFSVV